MDLHLYPPVCLPKQGSSHWRKAGVVAGWFKVTFGMKFNHCRAYLHIFQDGDKP